MIQAKPTIIREGCEALRPESLVFYPRDLVARDGPEYDLLDEQAGLKPLDWSATIDLDNLKHLIEAEIDADFIFYGVLCTDLYPTGNAVAANVITATARARAFALFQSLNGYQVITDGCTYRRDQIPACSYEECLRLQPDYPILRAEVGGPIPFLEPAEIPTNDVEFMACHREHVRQFFGVEQTEMDSPFAIPKLEHKLILEKATFDALACLLEPAAFPRDPGRRAQGWSTAWSNWPPRTAGTVIGELRQDSGPSGSPSITTMSRDSGDARG